MTMETHIMKRARNPAGFTILELLVVVLIVAMLLAVALPVIGKVRGDAGVQESMANLVTLDVAHVLYAADWNGRQVTWVVDDLAFYGSVANYNKAHGDCNSPFDESCHPPVIWGWGCNGWLYSYPMNNSIFHWAVEPINFPGDPGFGSGFGSFRYANVKAFHDYVTGRVYEETFYAPNDTVVMASAEPLFGEPCEFNPEGNPPIWISYALSPAAMFHPDVMRSNAAGGWQDPWSIDHGFESPGLFQALYPDLKTHMIEHNWYQNPPAECNRDFDPDFGTYNCEPYYFNHGIDSTPVTLFYDGHVRLLPNTEVFAADQQILKQTGAEDGLWHRGTPFGEDGYYISAGFDGVPLSHHILTTDGILGRDTIAETPPNPLAASWDWPRLTTKRHQLGPAADHRASFDLILTTSEEDQP